MHDVELYRHLLGLETPWGVARVAMDVKERRVDVWSEHREGIKLPCPECGKRLRIYDHAPERVWRHLDSCHFKTFLHARVPRVKCAEHGVKQARVPWAEPSSRFTAMFERLAIDVLLETNVQGAARLLDLSWDEAWYIQERAVRRGLARKKRRPIPRIGVDEKAIAKGHEYFTLVSDATAATVEYIADTRKQEALDGYFQSLTPKQLASIEAIAMDMWEPYVNSALQHVPDAEEKIVFDRFHIMQHVTRAVDMVRKREHRALLAEGDDVLKGSKYLWLYSQENMPERHAARFSDLQTADLKTGRAWAIKENLRHLWSYSTVGRARTFWKAWNGWATRSRLTPIVKAARTIRRHLDNILTFTKHRITNATAEGLNSKIQTVKQMARGFRNREHFRIAIYFRCGGLDLYPQGAH
jgi:transposase